MLNTEQANTANNIINDEESFNLRETIGRYLYHWPLFLLGIFLCLALSFLYLRYARPVYQVSSTLLIKDDKKAGLPNGDLLDQLDLFGDNKVVENEIEILQSKMLMHQVVDRLNLIISYQAEGRVINGDLYNDRPINFVAVRLNSTLYNQTLDLSFPDQTHYILKSETKGVTVKGTLNQLQQNIFGVYKIERLSDFSLYKKSLNILISDPETVNDQCLKRLTVNLANKQATVINLSYEETVPQRGKDVLNTLIQVYNEAGLADKNRTTESTIQFIDGRLKLITGELTDVEKDVERFKSSRGLTDISNDANLYLDNVKANDIRLSETNLQLGVIKDVQHYVNSNSSGEKLPSTYGIDDPILLAQINQLAGLQLKRDQLLSTTQANNPLVEPITKQIETTRAGIRSNIDNISSALLSTKRQLEGNNSQYQGSIKKIPGQEREYISIKRQQTIKETLYLYLLQKKEEAALSYASAVADSRIVDLAFSSRNPIKPKRSMIYMVALVLGLVLPAGYIYAKDLMNNKIGSVSDINKLTKVPILGEILYEEGTDPIVVQPNSRKAIAEQFRSIRTNMQFLHGREINGVGKVTLFTSSMSGEGKSFVTSNIGTALAISGRKTILLELDLRKPKISKYLQLSNKEGLSNYLIGKSQIEDIIQPSSVNPNLFVIGSGPVPPNPTELLLQKEMDDLIEYLRANFDEIIIDTPPIGLVTDAQILARLTDVTIYLVRQGVTFKDQIKYLDRLNNGHKFPKMNIILNGTKFGGSYGYGYGYGYYSDDDQHVNQNFNKIIKDIFKRF